MDDKVSPKGAWLHHITHFKFLSSIHISGMAVKLFTQGDYIKFCQRDDKSLSKGAWLGS